ncbi:sensor histidine kinase [Demequina sp.]|uniref:sensor histidine kinase n=1 Tax=Demequina sp. TaxID=2050685 RepID=UPI003A856512
MTPPAGEAPGAPTRRSPRLRRTVRVNILIAMVSLTAIALALAGLVAASLQEMRVEALIEDELEASAQEFRVLADVGVDPTTGEPFTSPADLVRTAMERIIPGRNEGVLGFVGGEMAYTARGADLVLEDDTELLAALEPLVTGDRSTFTSIQTPTTTYRIAVVPVRIDADGSLHEGANDATPAFDSVSALVFGYDMEAETDWFSDVFVTYALVALGALVVVGLIGWIVAGRLLRPMRVLAGTARRLGQGDLSERIPVTGSDDMADMTQSVNEMLARLERTFDSQAALMSDVSHELRTPLTVIRGHLELMDTDDPADAREVRVLVLDEVARMNRVVGDLSTLASVERPDFVTLEPVDLAELTDAVFDKSVALGDRVWDIDARADGTVPADRERLTQAWLQLVANAVKFSEPGTRIAIGSACDGTTAALWVADAGPGIASEDRERIFERFARAGQHRVQGSGLGLPIVQAIAQAHGGEVAVDSTPGEGSRFTVTIPMVVPSAHDGHAPDPSADSDAHEGDQHA